MVAGQMAEEDYRLLKQKMTSDAADLVAMTGGVEGKILLKSVPQLDVSSTRIRQQLSQSNDKDNPMLDSSPDESVKQWMPQAVYRQLISYIKE
jgi:nicotinic acid mononucleotide adenylyltransferase